jgi:hypothetical protein
MAGGSGRDEVRAALVVAIAGLLLLGIPSPGAWIMGRNLLAEIEAGERPPTELRRVRLAYWLGVVGTMLLGAVVLGVVAYVIVLITSHEIRG